MDLDEASDLTDVFRAWLANDFVGGGGGGSSFSGGGDANPYLRFCSAIWSGGGLGLALIGSMLKPRPWTLQDGFVACFWNQTGDICLDELSVDSRSRRPFPLFTSGALLDLACQPSSGSVVIDGLNAN